MARNPKPESALRLAGTYREDRHGRRKEPGHASGMPEAPEVLAGRAKEEWDWLVANLDPSVVQIVDRALLVSYCIAVEILERAYTQIVEDGITIDGSQGQPRKHPSMMTYRQATDVVSMVSGRFGFSPVDRAKVGTELGDSRDDLAEFLKNSAYRRAENS